jgi:hypothetical protein
VPIIREKNISSLFFPREVVLRGQASAGNRERGLIVESQNQPIIRDHDRYNVVMGNTLVGESTPAIALDNPSPCTPHRAMNECRACRKEFYI